MNNEDFRKLLQHPRPVVAHATEKKDDTTGGDEHERIADGSSLPRTNKTLEEINAKYVDRAELRRKGVEDLGEELFEMKGLDFSLLAKARAERAQERNAAAARHKTEQAQNTIYTHENGLGPSTSGNALHSPRETPVVGRNNQGRQLARAIEAALLEVTKETPSNMKATLASMSYIYVTEEVKYEVPVVRKRALTTKSEAGTSAEAEERSAAARSPLPKTVLDEICTIMRYCGDMPVSERKNRRMADVIHPNEAGTSVCPSSPVAAVQTNAGAEKNEESDEEDIFGDAGTDYVATAKKEPDAAAAKPATYFSSPAVVPTADVVYGDEVPDDRDDNEIGDKMMHGGPRIAERRMAESDGYDECYPDFCGGADMASDVDEEPEEQEPAAMSKKARKIASKKEQARLDSEFSSIQKIFEDKGYTHFADKAPLDKQINAVPKKKRRI